MSRYAKVKGKVDYAKVAEMIAEQLKGLDIEVPFNVVTPSLRDELVKHGVKIGPPEKGNAGKAAIPAYEEWLKSQGENGEQVKFLINPMTEEEASLYKPIGKGDFGDIYDQFKGNAKDAIRLLALKKSGEAIGALKHDKIGDIDLVWGKEGTSMSDGYGLSKILKYHPEVAENLQSILDSMEIKEWGENRIRLQNATHEAAVSLDYFGKKKKWLLTAYEKRESSATDKTMNTAGNHNDLQSDTALLQTEDNSVRKFR